MDYKEKKDFSALAKDLDHCKYIVDILRKNERKILSMIDAVSDSVYLIDKDYRYLFVNDELLSRLDLPREKILGKTFSQLHPSKESKDFIKIIERVVKTKKTINHEHRNEKMDKWFLRSVCPVIDNKTNEITSFAVVSKDISELKRAKKELEKTHSKLKNTTAQLIHNERLAALGELTAGVSHELKQPLNNIKIVCQEFLLDSKKNRVDIDMLPESFEELVGQVNKMAEIIDHMKVYTRNIDNQLKEKICISKPINDMFVLFGEQLRKNNIVVLKDLSPDLPRVFATSIALEQAFTNLVVNARNAIEDFGRNGGKIEIKSFERNKSEVAVSIKDNGGGVPSDIRNRIFEPFFTRRSPGKGVGMGLSITKKIIEEHNGRIELEVEEGESSKFIILLPVAKNDGNGD